MKGQQTIGFLILFLIGHLTCAPYEEEDCELHAPNTMHEFCCDIHDENSEFMDCNLEWSHKLEYNTREGEMEHNFCVSECFFNSTDFLKPDRKSLRMNVIKRHIQDLHDDKEAEDLIYAAYEKCNTHAVEMLEHPEVKKLEQRLEKHNCHPYPGLVFECISNEFILTCPDKHYHNTAACDDARDYLRTCLKRKR